MHSSSNKTLFFFSPAFFFLFLTCCVIISSSLPLSPSRYPFAGIYHALSSTKLDSLPIHSSDPGPSPPVWPNSFYVDFITEILSFHVFGSPSTLYYDWNIQSQRLDYTACTSGIVPFPGPCSFIFNATMTFLLDNISKNCCVLLTDVGTIPPNWAAVLSYQGPAQASGKPVQWWQGGTPVHNLFQDVNINSSMFLWVEDVNETWVFDPSGFNVGALSPSLFEIPPSCTCVCNATSC